MTKKTKITNYIVITSINKPTEAIRAFSKWKDWLVVVVGDRKSPEKWQCKNVVYLGIDEQHDLFGNFSKQIPENTYTRKMIGYLYSIKNGAEYIFESDDDNIPYEFGQDLVTEALTDRSSSGNKQFIHNSEGWVNIYNEFGASNCWPRGFPIETVSSKTKSIKNKATIKPLVTQFLADQDPDVDAIYRMTNQKVFNFKRRAPLCLSKGTFCPFNCQATLWSREAFPLMFFPLFVPDRVTDILRGYITLACLWGLGSTLEYRSLVVFQERNTHNLLNDFNQEIMLYKYANIWSILLKNDIKGKTASQLFESAISVLSDRGFIDSKNINCYKKFIREIGE